MTAKPRNFLEETVDISKRAFWYVLLFSGIVNLLLLALPIYSLQVLDRVIGSASMETLFMLTLIVVLLLAAGSLFHVIRSLTLVRIGEWFEQRVAGRLLSASIASAAVSPGVSGSQNLRDLATIKNFLSGPGLSAIFDAPWSAIYLLVIFMIHPLTFMVVLGGGLLLLLVAALNERAVKSALSEANEATVSTLNQVEVSARNAEVIEAMGMMDAVIDHWQRKNRKVLLSQALASNRAGVIGGVAKIIRLALQIIVVGLGAYLSLKHELTVGGIIACSILASRTLAPFEQAIGAWSNVVGAMKAYERLNRTLAKTPQRQQSMSLPSPEGRISVEKVIYGPPGLGRPVLKGISFTVNAGDSLGIIGPSAAGKSTLAKLLVGVWQPASGNVRLDGADVYTWKRGDFGRHIGYLPQDVELFEGTARDNIARMRDDASDEDVVAAAKMSGAHEMILQLPKGYETELGPGGANLSAGQRQRIGLARAFFGNPKLLVLDEPNANLDDAGENALTMAIKNAKALKITTIVIAHRPSILSSVDYLMVLKDGMITDFGPTKDILQKYTPKVAPPPKPIGIAAQPAQQQAAAKEAGEKPESGDLAAPPPRKKKDKAAS